MDERELANLVFSAVDAAAYQHQAKRVLRVVVAIGRRRVFEPARLTEAFAGVTRRTIAEGAVLDIHVLPARYRCRACGHDFTAEADEPGCARCGHPHAEATGGDELRLLSIDVEQLPTGTALHKEAS